ncbi:MAG: ribonuclease Y [Candidatus Falkowbacteria bacterium]|nr:ribonuclease Y [Candidatus Falkowbacteria bacterium]
MEYLLSVIAILVGFGGGTYLQKKQVKGGTARLQEKAEKLLAEAKTEKAEMLLKAKEDSFKIIDEAKIEEEKRRKEIVALQSRLEKRESTFSEKLLELQDKQQAIYDKIEKVEKAKERIKEIQLEQEAKLEQIAKMSKTDAIEVLFEKIKKEENENLSVRLKKLDEESQEVLEDKARHLITNTCQRVAQSVTSEFSSTSVDLPSDEMKGRIIGKEGRNIRTIEKLTGVEILVDDTPNVITISGFSLIRRHIAKRALESLMLDGRIQPAKIEEAVENAKKELAVDMKKAGENALYELGITGFDPKFVQIIGRLKYRTSYGQNCLLHSIQVGRISGFLAEELGLDTTLAKKGGLLHDIGKTVDQEIQGTHPEIGGKIARKFNLPEEVIDPIESHHDDKPRGIYSVIVKVADAISGSRQGARNDSFEKYLNRLGDLEKVATGFPGVEKVFAIQAGREIRVFVTPELIDDFKARELAKDIAHAIEQELKYPGEIKVNVIREMRVIEFAR